MNFLIFRDFFYFFIKTNGFISALGMWHNLECPIVCLIVIVDRHLRRGVGGWGGEWHISILRQIVYKRFNLNRLSEEL